MPPTCVTLALLIALHLFRYVKGHTVAQARQVISLETSKLSLKCTLFSLVSVCPVLSCSVKVRLSVLHYAQPVDMRSLFSWQKNNLHQSKAPFPRVWEVLRAPSLCDGRKRFASLTSHEEFLWNKICLYVETVFENVPHTSCLNSQHQAGVGCRARDGRKEM